MNNLKHYVYTYLLRLSSLTLFSIIKTVLLFSTPLIVQHILNNRSELSNNELVLCALSLLVMLLFRELVQLAFVKSEFSFNETFKKNEGAKLFHKLFQVKATQIDKNGALFYVHRIINALDHISSFLTTIATQVVVTSITITLSLLLIFNINIYLFALFMILLPLSFIGTYKLNKNLQRKCNYLQPFCSSMFQKIIGKSKYIPSIKQFNCEQQISSDIGEMLKGIQAENNNVNWYHSKIKSGLSFCIDSIKSIILIISIYFFIQNKISAGDLIFVNMLLDIYFSGIVSLNNLNLSRRDVVVSAIFIRDEIEQEQDENNGHLELKDIEHLSLDIKNFSYKEDTEVLNTVKLKINYGDHVCLVGRSGCGKSTVGKLISRQYISDSIFINDINIRDYTLESIRQKIFYMSQEVAIFPGTIEQNILLGLEEYDTQKLESLYSLPFVSSFLQNQTNGKDTSLPADGSNLSGGQKQIIAFARLFMRDPSLIILDEPTSAVDGNSFKDIINYILEKYDNKILIFISHDYRLVQKCKKIFVIKDKKMISEGSDHLLRASSSEYSQIFNLS